MLDDLKETYYTKPINNKNSNEMVGTGWLDKLTYVKN